MDHGIEKSKTALSRAVFILLLFYFPPIHGFSANGHQEMRNAKIKKAELNKRYQEFRETSQMLTKKNFESLLKRRNNLLGIELILAAPSSQSLQSYWGHVLIRFVDDDPYLFNDLVLSLAFDADEPQLEATKVIFGGYPMVAELLFLGIFMKQYVQSEGRHLERWALQLTPNQVNSFIDVLQKHFESSNGFGNYYFIGKNCASFVAKLMNESGWPQTVHLLPPQAPEDLQRYFKFRKISQLPPIRGAAVGWVVDYLVRVYNLDRTDVRRGQIPIEAFDFFKTLDFNTLSQVFYFFSIERNPPLYKLFAEEIVARKRMGERVYWGLEALPVIAYKACGDSDCLQRQMGAGKKIWGEGFKKNFHRQNYEVYTYDRLKFKKASDTSSPQEWTLKNALENTYNN